MRHRAIVSLSALSLVLAGCARDEPAPGPEETPPAAVRIVAEEQPEDSTIVEQQLSWARTQRLDTLPTGAIAAQIGRRFVGTKYTPGTLEVEGPERLVVNLREFDCVTFVESMLALARVVKSGGGYPEFKQELRRMRYRGGELSGYPSRLHYFSEWIADNDMKGIVENITTQLGGVRDPETISFMTSHVEAYRQLADSTLLADIRERERNLNQRERHVIPEGAIGGIADRIRDGDVIAAASTLPGLDIAHTGLALWVDGRLRLMHAPLVGSVVEISEQPLADRIVRIEGQDGIMVARPQS